MEWEYKPLDELGNISRGKSKHRPRNDELLFGGKYPFIQTGDVKAADLYITKYNDTYNEYGLAQSKLWPAGTLCITIAANIADTAILGIDACFPDSIMGFIPYKGVANVKFVKYCFDILQQKCKNISQGTTQDNLSWKKLSSIKFPKPSIEVQNKIAHVLSQYDNLIETNKKRIKILEQMAENLYKEWFVRFRFPGHEKAEFVDGVPKGWEFKRLSDIADIVMGQSPSSCYYNNNMRGLPFHQGVGSYGNRYLQDDVYSTEGKRIAEANSIIFSVRAPVGRLNITLNKIILGRGVAGINEKKGRNIFLYYLLNDKFAHEDLIGSGTIFSSVTKDELYKQKLLVPKDDICDKFDIISGVIEKEIRNIYKQNQNLIKQRDYLLPRLMSGKIKV